MFSQRSSACQTSKNRTHEGCGSLFPAAANLQTKSHHLKRALVSCNYFCSSLEGNIRHILQHKSHSVSTSKSSNLHISLNHCSNSSVFHLILALYYAKKHSWTLLQQVGHRVSLGHYHIKFNKLSLLIYGQQRCQTITVPFDHNSLLWQSRSDYCMTTVHMQLSKWMQESQASSDTPDMGKKSVTRLPAVSSMYSGTHRYSEARCVGVC